MTVLVTGGFGSIGAHTALALADLGEQVVVTRHRNAVPPPFLQGRVAVEQADLADPDAVRAIGDRHRITAIVHLAAVALEEPDPVALMRRNAAMLLNVLEAARTWRVRRFAVASSIGVYLGTPGPRWHEDLPLVPATAPNPILAFKKAVEAIAPQALDGTGVEPVILRIGTIWGPLGLPDSPFFPIPRLITATVRGEPPDLTPPRPPGFADDGGDRCYVKDCGRAIALLMHADTLRHDTYNISSGRPVANHEFVSAVNAAVPAVGHEELVPALADAALGHAPRLQRLAAERVLEDQTSGADQEGHGLPSRWLRATVTPCAGPRTRGDPGRHPGLGAQEDARGPCASPVGLANGRGPFGAAPHDAVSAA